MVHSLIQSEEVVYLAPGEVWPVSYEFDTLPLLAGETLESIGTPIISPSGSLEVTNASINGTQIVFLLSGQIAGVNYNVNIPVLTSLTSVVRAALFQVICRDE